MSARAPLGILTAALLASAAALAACAEEPQGIDPEGSTGTETTGVGVGPGGTGSGGAGATGTGTGSPTGSGTTNPTSGGPTAREMFISDVYPKLNTSTSLGLACTTCHAAGTAGAPVFFAAAGAEASYTAITGYTPSMIATPDNSTLVLHGTHAGPALDEAQEASVIAWLNQEVIERGLEGGGGSGSGSGSGSGGSTGSGGDPPLTLALAIEQFGDCMQLEDWEATGMTQLPEAQTEIGPCQGCHNAGDGGAWLSANDEETFERNRVFPYVRRLVSGTVDENGAFDTLIPARRFIEKGQEGCDPNLENCHPQYVLPPNTEQAVIDFVDITLERWENGECDLPPGGGEGGAQP